MMGKDVNALFDVAEEPPMREEGNDGDSEDGFAATDEGHPKEGGSAHCSFRVVQITMQSVRMVETPRRIEVDHVPINASIV